MRKIFWLVLCLFCCGAAMAEDDACQKSLRVGNVKVCLTPDKETVPALGAKFDDGSIYYAATVPGMHGGPTFKTPDNVYTLANQYELIHWLSGEDALVNNVWRDRMADTTSDTGGAMNFTNYGCKWNEEHTGYYSADGFAQNFQHRVNNTFDFGTDWYMEIVANVGMPLGTACPVVDLGFWLARGYGQACSIYEISGSGELVLGRVVANTRVGSSAASKSAGTGEERYTWGETAHFITGIEPYQNNQSRAFVGWNGQRYYGEPFDAMQWDRWNDVFYLFRGAASEWVNAGFKNVYQCGPTTIYDVKIWRKKS